MTDFRIGRRVLLGGAASLAALTLAGCATSGPSTVASETPRVPPDVLGMYAARPFERFPVAAARIDLVPPQYWRQVVDDPTGERPGTLVVDTRDADHEAGDLLQAGIDVSALPTLADVLARTEAQGSPAQARGPVFFKSCGWAGWDLAAARCITG